VIKIEHILVLDLGTSRCKAAVYDNQGRILSSQIKEYDIILTGKGLAEQDANQVWQMVKEVIKRVINGVDKPEMIMALCFSVQGEAVMPIDQDGYPLHNVILGMDTRCVEENNYLRNVLGEEKLYYLTGMPIHTVNTLPKILWLKNNRQDIFNKAWKFVLYEDFLMMKMCGEPVIDACLASRTQMYDINKNKWSEDILKAVDISPDRLSRVTESGQIIGEIKRELIKELNLTSPVYLVAGGHDQACAALGAGVTEDYMAMDSIGTAEVAEVAASSLKLDRSLMGAKISTYRHVISGMYLTMTLNHTAGLLVRWVLDHLFPIEIQEAEEKKVDKYSYVFSKLKIQEPSYKLILPHFNGSGTPWVKDYDYGLIMGLSLADDKYSLLQAVLEGLVYELKINLEILKSAGYRLEKLIAVGGGAKSDNWLNIRASILNSKLITLSEKDSALLGAYFLAAHAVGIFPDIKASISRYISKGKKQFAPLPGLTEKYKQLFSVYKNIYPQIKEFNQQIYDIKNCKKNF
jgi:xylulokinase